MVDRRGALGAEFREVGERERDGTPARVVVASRTYPADREELWDALTSAERIPRWLSPITGELSLGGQYQLEGNAGGTVTRCDRPTALGVTWEYAGNVSWVEVRLDPDGTGTRLTLEHIMPVDEAAEAHWAKYGPAATGVGWDLAFFGMGLHLDSGAGAIEREAKDAWLVSQDGRAFVRTCAKAWERAHIAAGENPDAARAMAARTADFYAGD